MVLHRGHNGNSGSANTGCFKVAFTFRVKYGQAHRLGSISDVQFSPAVATVAKTVDVCRRSWWTWHSIVTRSVSEAVRETTATYTTHRESTNERDVPKVAGTVGPWMAVVAQSTFLANVATGWIDGGSAVFLGRGASAFGEYGLL